MAKTGIIATAFLNTSKGKFEPGEAVKGLPADEMKKLKELKAVKQIIVEPNASIQDDTPPKNNTGGSSEGGKNDDGTKTDGTKTPPKTNTNGDK